LTRSRCDNRQPPTQRVRHPYPYPYIQDLIKNKWKDLEEIHDELDSTSPITLVMNGKTLFSGKTMGDYKIGEAPKTGPKWRSPYAGACM
jgi:hypothetical protein